MSIADATEPTGPAAARSESSRDAVRKERGRAILALGNVRMDGKDNRYRVTSQLGDRHYLVSIERKKGPDWRCECRDFETREKPCKHIHAVLFAIEREKGGNEAKVAATAQKPRTFAQQEALAAQSVPARKTYKQDWPAYNAAQTTEKHRFQELLRDLCAGVQEPPRKQGSKPGGRPRLSRADMIFAAAFKVYSTVSGRRFMCDLADAHQRGYIDKVPHFNSVFNALEDPELTPILGDLIRESALPLRSIESDFAIDSSGFTTSRFIRWFDKKYGVVKAKHEWVKVSVMTGVRTNIVTAVRVGNQTSQDAPEFIPLLEQTAKGFEVKEVSADKAYASYDNFHAANWHGATAYIAFPVTTTGRRGGNFARMFHLYNLNRDDYLAHYHKRSNVESTFSMVKAKFGDALRSKTDTAMVNEALCKVLCHNVCCLIQSATELGVETKFWQDDTNTPKATEVEAIDEWVAAMAWV
ncbi:transposase [Tundrisphaera sp. TA3]|uniref:transposase n=1 Tax=Tundrisphaera sp. TA3 TaxID=3435775 RepID=UPI003EB72BAA